MHRRAAVASVPEARCRHCGEPFCPTRELQVFCRPSCRLAHTRRGDPQLRLPLDDVDDPFRIPTSIVRPIAPAHRCRSKS
jgi:hypothetical protein